MANKITQFTEDVEVIQKLGDHPNSDDGISADELKAKFDQAGSAIKQYLNEQVVPAVQELQEGISKVDKTLTQEGYFADAKATGEAIAKAKEDAKAEADRAAESAAAAAEIAAESANKANQAVEAAEAAVEEAEDAAERAATEAVKSISDVISKGAGTHSVQLCDAFMNEATDDYAMASGYSTHAGGKGYQILEAVDNGDGTGVYTLSSVQMLDVGNEYSVRLDKPLHKAGKILAIDGNQVTVDGYQPIAFDDVDPITHMPTNYLSLVDSPWFGDTKVGLYAHAEGECTVAAERASHAEGRETKVIGQYGHAEGRLTTAAYAAHSEGRETEAIGNHAHAEGFRTGATGDNAHAEGYATQATNKNTHAEGNGTKASGIGSHAEGFGTAASGDYAHSEGTNTEANGHSSHAEGNGSIAYTQNSHAEGESTKAGLPFDGIANNDRRGCHAEGVRTVAVRVGSHAEGVDTRAEGQASHAEGQKGYALGKYSHAEGYNTIARGEAQHVAGKYNVEDAEGKYAHILGAGTSAAKRKNIHTIDWDGNVWFAGNIKVGGAGHDDANAATVLTTADINSIVQTVLKAMPTYTGEVEVT